MSDYVDAEEMIDFSNRNRFPTVFDAYLTDLIANYGLFFGDGRTELIKRANENFVVTQRDGQKTIIIIGVGRLVVVIRIPGAPPGGARVGEVSLVVSVAH